MVPLSNAIQRLGYIEDVEDTACFVVEALLGEPGVSGIPIIPSYLREAF